MNHPKTKTTEQFISEAKEIHGDEYDYSLVKYKKLLEKVKIICKDHGVFEQKPHNHLRGQKCLICKNQKQKYTVDVFIKKARKVHGYLYDYTSVIYRGSKTKIKIKCEVHGIFEQMPSSHLLGNGCIKCAIADSKINFFIRAKEIHGELYDYSLVKYNRIDDKVKIICKKHGVFTQTPHGHFLGQGCPLCNNDSRKRTIKEFISKAKKIHNEKYSYDLVEYVNSHTKVKIICLSHMTPLIFEQRPSHHLQGNGCPRCSSLRNSVGKNELEHFTPYIDKLSDYYEPQYRVECDDTCYFVDFYIPKFNLVIEYDEPHHHYKKKNIESDKKRQKYIEEKLGCDFIRIDDKKFMENKNYANNILSKYFDCLEREDIEELFD